VTGVGGEVAGFPEERVREKREDAQDHQHDPEDLREVFGDFWRRHKSVDI
jgi:hypothetical protein